MKQVRHFSREHRWLLAINGVLLLALLGVTIAPAAIAQRVNRPRGDYTMVSGRALGFAEDAIYIVDRSNQEMVAMRYDRSTKTLKFIGYRNMAEDARHTGRRGR